MSFEYKEITDTNQAQAAIRAALVMAIGKGAITRKGFDHAMGAVEWIEKALQPSPAPAWQPIATAPKDGTEIFVCNADGYQREIVFWDSDPNNLGWHTTDGRSFYKYAGDFVAGCSPPLASSGQNWRF